MYIIIPNIIIKIIIAQNFYIVSKFINEERNSQSGYEKNYDCNELLFDITQKCFESYSLEIEKIEPNLRLDSLNYFKILIIVNMYGYIF